MVFIKFKLIYLIIIIFLLLKLIKCDEGEKYVKTIERKFGDRILPRNKQQIEDRNINLLNNNNNNNISVSSNHNSNNISNNNNSYSEFNVFNYNSVLGSIATNPTNSADMIVTNSASDNNNSDKLHISNISFSSASSSVRKPKIRNLSDLTLTTVISENSNIQAHRLEMSTEFFVVPSPSSSLLRPSSPSLPSHTSSPAKKLLVAAPSRSTTIRPGGMIIAAKTTTTESPLNTNNFTMHYDKSGLRKEPWVVPILVLSSITMIMMAGFEGFVLFKAWRTSPSRRHLFLGQMLLLGLFACAGLGAIITMTPTLLSCAIIRFGAGVAFALVFASLLVKCVFLISLNSGVYLPAPYQALLLLFAVLIQVAVGTQWLITSPPSIDNVPVSFGDTTNLVSSKYSLVFTSGGDVSILNQSATKIPLCKTQFSEFLLSLVYVIFLIVFVTVLAIKSRRIRDNYREATYIGLSIGGIIPIWLGWTLCGLVIAERHRDACLAFGLVATAATVFLVMFMPKGRQLAAMGKEGFYVEDREEHFSSLSRAGSGYSPSFFHFKPIKYGVMGTAQTNNTNILLNGGDTATTMQTQNIKSNQGVATLGGDHVTLIAVPPSYTRMYHYFPAHLTQPICYYSTQQSTWYPGLFIRPDDTNLYTTLEPTMSSNPNVYFQRGIHPGMMY